MESLSLIASGLTSRRLSDEAVATRALSGDSGAFGELYRRYRQRVAALCTSRLGDSDRGEDAAQETFVRVLRAAPQPVENAQAWLFTIAKNVCTDVQRRSSNAETPTDSPDLGKDLPTPDSAAELMRRETARVVFLALRRLPTRSRTALMLREFHGMSSAEIAESMGISKGAVDPLVSRARDAFGVAYAEVGNFPERCRENVERIYRDLGSGLEPEERKALDAHLAGCARCRTEHRRAHSTRYQRALVPFLVPGMAKLGILGRALERAALSPGVLRGLPVGRIVATAALGAVVLTPTAVDYELRHRLDAALTSFRPLPSGPARVLAPDESASGSGASSNRGTSCDSASQRAEAGHSMSDLCTGDYRTQAPDHSGPHASGTHEASGHDSMTTGGVAWQRADGHGDSGHH